MYNPQIKTRFLEVYNPGNTQKNFPSSMFAVLENHEETLGKDLGEMDRAEAKEVLNTSGFNEYGTVRNAINVLKHYTTWCKENRVFQMIPGGFLELTAAEIDITDAVRRSYFRDEQDFLSTIRLVREFDQGYPEPVLYCFAWLGLKIREALSLRDDDVNMDNRTICLAGEIIVDGFSDGIYNLLEQYIDCDSAERGHATGSRLVMKDYSVDFFMKKMLSPNSKDWGRVYNYNQMSTAMGRLNRKLKEAGYPGRLQYEDVWNSGCYNRLWRAEQSGVDVFATKNRAFVEQIIRQMKGYHNTLVMYRIFKKAFEL